MLAGKLLVESFNYGVQDVELPLYEGGAPLMDGATGLPQVARFKILHLEVLPGLTLELRVREEQWEDFVAGLAGNRPQIKVASEGELRRLAPAPDLSRAGM